MSEQLCPFGYCLHVDGTLSNQDTNAGGLRGRRKPGLDHVPMTFGTDQKFSMFFQLISYIYEVVHKCTRIHIMPYMLTCAHLHVCTFTCIHKYMHIQECTFCHVNAGTHWQTCRHKHTQCKGILICNSVSKYHIVSVTYFSLLSVSDLVFFFFFLITSCGRVS